MTTQIVQTVSSTFNVISSSISFNFGSACATDTIECISTSLQIGNELTHTINGVTVFLGYVKQITKDVAKFTVTINAIDILTRALDYFIVPTSPTDVLTYNNISGEQLISNLLAIANITNTELGTTSFTFATTTPMEIKLVSVYDMCKTVSDLLSWHIWADKMGKVFFKNRKPYVMVTPSEDQSQPGFVADSITGPTITDTEIISGGYSLDNTNLRNKIVVQGEGTIYAVASAVSPYLPNLGEQNFYATVFFSDYQLISSQADAQRCADYNLVLLNKLTKRLNIDIIGTTSYECYDCVHVDSTKFDIDSDWFIYGLTHSVSNSGFITSLDLRQA